MPILPSILNSIEAVRTFSAAGGGERVNDSSPYTLCHYLFQNPDLIFEDAETLDAVLALAPEIEAYRGKGSQIIQNSFNRRLGDLPYYGNLKVFRPSPSANLFSAGNEPPVLGEEVPFWAERLSDYFSERVRGKPARSQQAASLRSVAWVALGELSHLCRRPEHLTLALKTAAEMRNSEVEREGAIQFLLDFWAHEDPDQATIDLLESLRKNPPNRSLLVSVLLAQIQLGLNDEMGALCAVDDWDDAEEEGEEWL